MTIINDYVSFELAQELKLKGFPQATTCSYYNSYGNVIDRYYSCLNIRDLYVRPTLYMVQKWLREEHNIDIYISRYSAREIEGYGYLVLPNIHSNVNVIIEDDCKDKGYKYEEALLEAIEKIINVL